MASVILIACVVVAIGAYALCRHYKHTRAQVQDPIDKLKNALLTYALARVHKDKFDEGLRMDYQNFDGSSLPSMSGYSTANACFTYILPKAVLRTGPFYTQHMEDKVDAVNRYLAMNFDTDNKVTDFFDQFVAAFDKDEENDPAVEPVHAHDTVAIEPAAAAEPNIDEPVKQVATASEEKE